MDKIRILIADADAYMRANTRQILEHEEDMAVIAEATNSEDAVAQARKYRPDIVIIDLIAPVADGIKAARKIKTCCPTTSVLILTSHDDKSYVMTAVEAGADGYILKNNHAEVLLETIREAYSGNFSPNRWLTMEMLERRGLFQLCDDNLSIPVVSK